MVINLKKISNFAIAAILAALIVPAIAQSPSDAINANRDTAVKSISRTIIDPNDPNYVWGNPLAVDLTNMKPSIFDSPAFQMASEDMTASSYTTSINRFRAADPSAGASNATRNGAEIGLIHWPGKNAGSVSQSANSITAVNAPSPAMNETDQ